MLTELTRKAAGTFDFITEATVGGGVTCVDGSSAFMACPPLAWGGAGGGGGGVGILAVVNTAWSVVVAGALNITHVASIKTGRGEK